MVNGRMASMMEVEFWTVELSKRPASSRLVFSLRRTASPSGLRRFGGARCSSLRRPGGARPPSPSGEKEALGNALGEEANARGGGRRWSGDAGGGRRQSGGARKRSASVWRHGRRSVRQI
ncbi:hypothetical protein ABZP36_017494 [Zizania latifolia]